MFLFPLNSYQKIHSNTYERNMAYSIACYWCYNSAWKTLVAMVSGHQYQYELLLYFSVNIVIGYSLSKVSCVTSTRKMLY